MQTSESLSLSDEIRAEQARTLHRHLLINALTDFIASLLMTAGMSSAIPLSHLLPWNVLVLLNDLGIVALYQSGGKEWQPTHPVQQSINRKLRLHVLSACMVGLIWGAEIFFILVLHQVSFDFTIICICVFAMLSGAVALSGHYLPLFYGFFVPCSALTLSALLILHHQPPLIFLTLGAALYAAFVWVMARAFNRSFVAVLRLRFENAALADQLLLQKQAAEAANLAKSRFLVTASHDLRQPMHAMSLYLAAMNQPWMPAQGKAMLSNALQCSAQMEDMFRALLDTSKLDANLIKPTLREVNMRALLQPIGVQFGPVAINHNISLRVAKCSAVVMTDATMLQRILNNFVTNALRYTQQGKVLVGCKRRGRKLRLMVMDTGPGIAEEHRQAIFDEFYQISVDMHEVSETPGLGLGLYIVKRLSHLLDCRVQVESVIGKGSCFSIELPLIQAARDESELSLNQSRLPTALAAGRLALVIDDDPAILNATRAWLEQQRYQVIIATHRDEALRQLNQQTHLPDIILCDFRLGAGESGIDVIQHLRQEYNRDIPALLLTGDTSAADLHAIKNCGVTCLHKPINQTTLIEAMNAALEAQTVESV